MTQAADSVSFKEGEKAATQSNSLIDLLQKDFDWSDVLSAHQGQNCTALDQFPSVASLLEGWDNGNPEAPNTNESYMSSDDPRADERIQKLLGDPLASRPDWHWGQDRAARLQSALMSGDLDQLRDFIAGHYDTQRRGLDTVTRDLNMRLENAGSGLRIMQNGDDSISIYSATGRGQALQIRFNGDVSTRNVFAHRHGHTEFGESSNADPRQLLRDLVQGGRADILYNNRNRS